MKFFAEIQADRLTPDHIALLARAGFTEIEAGVQSRDPAVLRAIHRPEHLALLDRNIRRLTQAGIRVTIDLLYGLPGQRATEVLGSLRWAWRQRRTHVQCLQTLLLPGTELRARRRALGLRADNRPPYGIRATPAMSATDMRRIEETVFRRAPADSPTTRFVGHVLPDLFPARARIDLATAGAMADVALVGLPMRAAVIFRGADLFAQRAEIVRIVRRDLRAEPHALRQFVLQPAGEEPLDLLDLLIAEIRRVPPQWLDRLAVVSGRGLLASRRVLILLRRGGRYSAAWRRAAEDLLAAAFY